MPNLPDLGKSPAGAVNVSKSMRLTELSTVHNQFLKTSLETLSKKNPKISITSIDMQVLFSTVANNPSKFGLTNVTQPCFNRATGTICAEPNSFLFWDELHPTAAAYQILSAHALTALRSNGKPVIFSQAKSTLKPSCR